MSEYVNPFTLFVVSLAGAGIGAYVGAYLREKGKNLATHEDINSIVVQLRKTTEAAEDIKAQISGELWVKQTRWARKWDCYVEIVKNLGEIHTLISEAMALDPGQPNYARDLADKQTRANDAFLRARQFGSIARIAVPPNVRTVLTRFGDQWNKSVAAEHRGIVARWGWLVITDIARNDLFGERREMSDEFAGDVDVPAP